MGSLSNLYISQSYISLIHLGSDNVATSTPTELQDGLGNGVGVSVSTNGNLYVSGNIYATNLTGSGGIINTGSFATTGSNIFYGDQIISGSGVNGLTVTNGIQADYFYTDGQGVFTPTLYGASIGYGKLQIEALDGVNINGNLTASLQQGYVWVGDSLNKSTLVATSSLVTNINTGSFATTGSNTFIGTQTINGDISASGNIYGANLTASALPSGLVSSSAQIVIYDTNGFANFNDSIAFDISQKLFTSSFNSYTQSTNDFTASISTSVGLLQTFSASADSRYVQNSQTSSMAVSSSTYAVTASYAINSTNALNASDILVYVKNTTGFQINKGKVVKITSATGDNALIGTASWDNDSTSANTLGFVTANIANDDFGYVMTQGSLIGVNTNGFTAGQILYLSSSGDYTNVIPPAPYHEVRLGQVLRPQINNGSIYVSIQNGYELGELHDVDINTGSLTNNDLLAYNSASGQWENKSIGTLGIATTSSVNDLSASIYQTDATQSVNISSNSSSIGLLQTFSGSQYKNDSSSFDSRINAAGGNLLVQDEGTILGTATSFNFIGAGVTASISAGTASITIAGTSINTGSFATTGSNTFTGNQTIEGSIVSNPTTGLTELFSQAFVSGAVQYNITASNAVSQSNLVFGGNPSLSTLTGSVVISGSNNILFNPSKNLTGANAFNIGYVNGNNNIFNSIPTLHTQSLFQPTINNNIGYGALALNFITSSLGVPAITNNNTNGTTIINHQSGSISYTNNIGNGAFTSTANITNLPFQTTITANAILGAGVTLNHISSSVTYQGNIGGGLTVNNNVSTSLSATTNGLTVSNNSLGGSGNVIYTSGSAVSTRRVINQNIFGGNTNVISASSFNSENQNLIGTVIWGTGLNVSATHPASGVTVGGGAFFGKFNDTNNLYNDSGKILFAVGTGTSTSNRKTALSIDSGSTVNISGSLTVTSSVLNIDGSGNVTASTILLTNNGSTAIQYNQQSTGSVAGVWATSYGKDSLQVYQYQGQPYAFNVNLTANQLLAYTGSEFQWGLQTNGTLSLPGGGSTYFSMTSGSTITGSGAGANKVGLDYLQTAMILDMRADTAFNRSVYVDKGMFVSQSVGGGKTALIVDGTNSSNNRAIVATGSVSITNVLNLKPNDPLPSGNIGDLAVSGSSLYFYNGAWTLVI